MNQSLLLVPRRRVQGVVVRMLVRNGVYGVFVGQFLKGDGDDVAGTYDVVDIGVDWKKHDTDRSKEDESELVVVYAMDV